MIIEASKFFVGLLVVTPILLLLGCASSQYKDTSPYNEGDLVLGEIVITDNVKRVYGTQDLKSLGWNANDVEEVVLTRFKQQFRTFTKDPEPILGLHALVPPDLDVENGDVVVARAEISDSIDVHGTKFVIIQIIEKYNDTGKCYYQDTGRPSRYFRYGIWCKDLEKEGWQWNNDFFEKRVNPNLKTVTIANKIDGKVLVMMTLEQEEWVYSGHPTSFTGNDLTLAIPLGSMTKQVALDVFTTYYQVAEVINDLEQTASYQLLVKPIVKHFEYSFNSLKNLGFSITPQVEIDLQVTLYDGNGKEMLSRTYSSGTREGDSFSFSTAPQERIIRLARETLLDLMTLAAKDAHKLSATELVT